MLCKMLNISVHCWRKKIMAEISRHKCTFPNGPWYRGVIDGNEVDRYFTFVLTM